MAWYALYKWYHGWSKIGYPNMNRWYSDSLHPPEWRKMQYENAKTELTKLLIINQLLTSKIKNSPYLHY